MYFKSTDEIRLILPVGSGTDFQRLRPHIQFTESNLIRPLLGPALYLQLQDFYNPEETGSSEMDSVQFSELLPLVQKATILLAYWSGFQVLNATISDTGFKRTESEFSKSLFKYQEDELKNHFKVSGFNALDEILLFLEENIEDFPVFQLTETYTVFLSSFIPDTKTFDHIIDIQNSRLTFLRLHKYFGLIEDMYIRPILGEAIFSYIKTDLSTGEPFPKTMAILPYIQKAMAYLSSSLLMEESGADLTEKGLYFDSITAGSISNQNHQPTEIEKILLLSKRNRSIGENYLERLKSFLLSNLSDWPDYPTPTPGFFRRSNDNKRTFWT